MLIWRGARHWLPLVLLSASEMLSENHRAEPFLASMLSKASSVGSAASRGRRFVATGESAAHALAGRGERLGSATNEVHPCGDALALFTSPTHGGSL